MNFVAIICEHNPPTFGHSYIIKKAKELTGLPVLCLCSGNFVQRGTPSIIDKYSKANATLQLGADVVLELPVYYSLSSAPDFAYGAINILNKIKQIKYLIFGSECGDINLLKQKALEQENELQSINIKQNLKTGLSYSSSVVKDDKILSKPNNLLGVEYLKALNKLNSLITPITIKREDNFNNNEGTFKSSSYARKLIMQNKNLTNILPEASITNLSHIVNFEKYYDLINFNILQTTPTILKNINGVKEGIENKIIKEFNNSLPVKQKIANIISKRYNKNYINRILSCSLLGITKGTINLAKQTDPYAKVIGIKNKEILKSLVQNDNITILTTKKDYNKLNINQKQLINYDLFANKIYSIICNSYHPHADFITKL